MKEYTIDSITVWTTTSREAQGVRENFTSYLSPPASAIYWQDSINSILLLEMYTLNASLKYFYLHSLHLII